MPRGPDIDHMILYEPTNAVTRAAYNIADPVISQWYQFYDEVAVYMREHHSDPLSVCDPQQRIIYQSWCDE